MDILATSNAWLEGRRKSFLSSEVTYRRGVTSLAMSATMGVSTYTEDDSEGVLTEIRRKDFVFTRSDFFPIFGDPVEGDVVEQIINGILSYYEVKAPSGVPQNLDDNHGLSIRVHTQLVTASSQASYYYHGVGDSGLSVAQIQSLTSFQAFQADQLVTESPNIEVFYFAYPAVFGVLSEIRDHNNFDMISDYTLRVENFTIPVIGVVSYNIYEYNHVTIQTNFNVTYKF